MLITFFCPPSALCYGSFHTSFLGWFVVFYDVLSFLLLSFSVEILEVRDLLNVTMV